jgi:hypothetical protein
LYIDHPDVVPDDLRPLFDLVFVPYNDEGSLPDDFESPLLVGLAMAERFTGLDLTPEDVVALYESGFFAAPNLVYLDDLGSLAPVRARPKSDRSAVCGC